MIGTLKELRHDILSSFSVETCKITFNLKEPQNITLVRQKNIKEVIINQEGTTMVKDGED